MTVATADTSHLNAQLDADPDSGTLRRILADAMQDAGEADAVCDGYRALAACGASPRWNEGYPLSGGGLGCWEYWLADTDDDPLIGHRLPADWLVLMAGQPYRLPETRGSAGDLWSMDYQTRRVADDDAARAFAGLPPARRAALLRGEL